MPGARARETGVPITGDRFPDRGTRIARQRDGRLSTSGDARPGVGRRASRAREARAPRSGRRPPGLGTDARRPRETRVPAPGGAAPGVPAFGLRKSGYRVVFTGIRPRSSGMGLYPYRASARCAPDPVRRSFARLFPEKDDVASSPRRRPSVARARECASSRAIAHGAQTEVSRWGYETPTLPRKSARPLRAKCLNRRGTRASVAGRAARERASARWLAPCKEVKRWQSPQQHRRELNSLAEDSHEG
jgi:hypothetical protein